MADLSFYDFDTGQSLLSTAGTAVECMQMSTEAAALEFPPDGSTELLQLPQADFIAGLSDSARAVALTMPSNWNTMITYATQYGIGADK